ncbi:MAG: AAA domain-containing protein, partial [Planctomyces sp.]
AEVAAAHWQGIGRSQGPVMAESIRILKHEIQKQRRHLPMRELLQKAGPAIQAVKPVFMMSPLSVSQFLDPGTLEFDMLLIDEASQVRPVEALGAAARCRQMVVVGDDKQMPPTQFFGKVLGDVTVDTDAPEMQAGDVESILGLAIARNMPQRMLRWHYRSRHESLIAVSNREFYDNQLYVIPSPETSGELGVKWKYIENGRFSDGRNEVEAQVVAEAVMKHAAEHPKWTLGVAAFSVSQRDAIQDAVEALRRKQPELETFFDTNAPDPFFIKNLENVQGDERDVIFVSVGYGPNESGRVSLNFGPVSSSGGERRLNVLMTRAKRVLQMFSSMKAEDIDLTRATGRGPAVFREYLKFAEHGGSLTTEKTSSESERIVVVLSRLLKERGFDVRTRVGIAGLYVDLAVIDPANPSRYLLGVLIDGETWRSARSTRDRNRTTEGVLTAQGWNIHHLWSPEWFRRPAEQMNRLIERIEAIRSGREKKKEGRLASVSSEVERRSGEPDPLSVLVAGVAPVPPAVTRPAGTGEQGGLLSDLVSTGLKVGAAVLVADKGKGLEAALDALSEKDSRNAEKPDEKTEKPKKKASESQDRKKK